MNTKLNSLIFSPRSYLKKILYGEIPYVRGKKNKVSKEQFEIPNFEQHDHITQHNYNVSQLKKMCKFYNQKVSGNKEEIRKRIYNFLKYSKSACIIQKIYKRRLVQRYIKCHGPAMFKRNKCVNEVDFLTLNLIRDIPHYQFFTYCDKDGFFYCFDICSLYNLFKNSNNHPKNPFNRNDFPSTIIDDLRNLIRLCRILCFPVKIELDKDAFYLSSEQKVIVKINAIFQKIDELGNYTDSSWFIALNRLQLIRYLRELFDIWCYRAQLSMENKINICPPNGNPFSNFQLSTIHHKNLTQMRKTIINIIEIFVTRGVDHGSRNLGAFYCLGALTLVSQNAANTLPWLYDSVVHIVNQ